MPTISAQESPQKQDEEIQSPAEDSSPADRIRAYEQTLTFDESDPAPAGTGGGSSIWSLVRMLLTLALVAAAVYGIVFLLKRSSKQSAVKDPFLKILATAHLGFNRYAHIVAVGSKAWLVGAGDGGVNLISEIEDKDILNAMMLEDSQKSAETAPGRFDFLGMLRRFGAPIKSGNSGADDIRQRRERLKGL